MSDGIQFDATSLEELGRDLRRAAERVRLETDVTLLKIGAEITAASKAIASQHSKTIAGTIKMRKIPGAVVISGGDEATPIAALYEVGNKGSKVSATQFRHPIFGRKDIPWAVQDKHPYLRPALAADRRGITKRMEETWDRSLSPYRLKPGG